MTGASMRRLIDEIARIETEPEALAEDFESEALVEAVLDEGDITFMGAEGDPSMARFRWNASVVSKDDEPVVVAELYSVGRDDPEVEHWKRRVVEFVSPKLDEGQRVDFDWLVVDDVVGEAIIDDERYEETYDYPVEGIIKGAQHRWSARVQTGGNLLYARSFIVGVFYCRSAEGLDVDDWKRRVVERITPELQSDQKLTFRRYAVNRD